jgi:hypothetical protein
MRMAPPAPRLGNRRHVMDHIAKRGRLDEQDVRHAFARDTNPIARKSPEEKWIISRNALKACRTNSSWLSADGAT